MSEGVANGRIESGRVDSVTLVCTTVMNRPGEVSGSGSAPAFVASCSWTLSTQFRDWGHWTDRAGDPVTRDATMRADAHVEDHIRRLKDSGLCRFPFRDLDGNRAWLAAVCFAGDLVRWFQLLCLTGPLADAEPNALRWQFWHAPARVIRRAHVTSSAFSTAGPTHTPSSTPIDAPPRSAEHPSSRRSTGRPLASTRPAACPGEFQPAPQQPHHREIAPSGRPEWPARILINYGGSSDFSCDGRWRGPSRGMECWVGCPRAWSPSPL
jgi:hypothetical protein